MPANPEANPAATCEPKSLSPVVTLLALQRKALAEYREAFDAFVQDYLSNNPGVTGLILDLARVSQINSTGLGTLFQMNRRLRDRGAHLVFVNTPMRLQRLFRAVGLDRLIPFFANTSAALDYLHRPSLEGPVEDFAPLPAPPL